MNELKCLVSLLLLALFSVVTTFIVSGVTVWILLMLLWSILPKWVFGSGLFLFTIPMAIAAGIFLGKQIYHLQKMGYRLVKTRFSEIHLLERSCLGPALIKINKFGNHFDMEIGITKLASKEKWHSILAVMIEFVYYHAMLIFYRIFIKIIGINNFVSPYTTRGTPKDHFLCHPGVTNYGNIKVNYNIEVSHIYIITPFFGIYQRMY